MAGPGYRAERAPVRAGTMPAIGPRPKLHLAAPRSLTHTTIQLPEGQRMPRLEEDKDHEDQEEQEDHEEHEGPEGSEHTGQEEDQMILFHWSERS